MPCVRSTTQLQSKIYDQVVEEYDNHKKLLDQLVDPYLPTKPLREYTYEQYLALDAPKRYSKFEEDFEKEKELMSNNWQDMVNEFREAMDLPIADGPRALSTEEQNIHIRMIREEFEYELVPAIMSGDLIEMYDAGIDVLYYLIGFLSNAGMQIDPGFREVHASNMSKMDPVTKKAIKAGPDDPSGEPEGKVLKGSEYFEPKLGVILNDQARYGHENTSVYKSLEVPLTLGIGGPKIGTAKLDMDNNGNIEIEGVMDDVSILPVIDHLGFFVSAVSIGDDEGPELYPSGFVARIEQPTLFADDFVPPYDR